MPNEKALLDSIKDSILAVWKSRAANLFEGEIKPETDFAKEIVLAVAQVTYELATAEPGEASEQKLETLRSAKRILKRKAEEKGAVIKQEAWEASMETLEAVGYGIALFAKGLLKGIL